jgi:uncharacterized protein involved in exopolysaccharide biosynthesis
VALETDWVRLTRGVNQARRNQGQLEIAVFDATLSASSEASGHGVQMTVIDPAFAPRTALPPSRMAIIALFAAATLVVGIFVAVIRTALDDRVYEARDIATLSLVLAKIPRASP